MLTTFTTEGKQLACSVSRAFYNSASETESAEGRPFAMMAAQGLSRLWIFQFLGLVLLNYDVRGSNNGTCTLRSVRLHDISICCFIGWKDSAT